MPETSPTEFVAAIAAALAAIGSLVTLILNTKTKNAIALRDSETKARLELLAAEAKITKERADYAALASAAAADSAAAAGVAVQESRNERQEQFQRMETKAETAFNHANSTNDKIATLHQTMAGQQETIARQQSEILNLRQLQSEVAAGRAADSAPDSPVTS